MKGEIGTYADPAYPSPAGTKSYTIKILLDDPAKLTDPTCSLSVGGSPLDHGGGPNGGDRASFSIVP